MNAAISNLINQPVGFVRVSRPVEFTDRGYECAAWWQTRLGATGVYSVYLRQDFYNKKRLYLEAVLPATIKEDYFPSLFCGNLIGKPYNATANAGQQCADVRIVKDLVSGVCESSKYDDDADGTKWAISPENWDAYIAHFQELAADHFAYLQTVWANYAEASDATLQDRASTVYHASQWIADATKAVGDIKRQAGYHAGSFARYYTENNPFLATLAIA